jgi:hypothetical protein
METQFQGVATIQLGPMVTTQEWEQVATLLGFS